MERGTPGKPQSRSEARKSGAKGVLDGGMLPPFPPNLPEIQMISGFYLLEVL